ncbi:AraC family transcriptional regulator [Methylobacterium organophilum]|uniref:HTH-type transcriptional activator RhaS n=1 Tax=Methylobacterium organophilum TaxID=410 RepID=A0ABQ4TB95_METOR|nr:AraC family transcriptional regulator [Methylobacterium organophilum]GJE27621.1 HTH-type transcriptional activator RhaS [Methylobacterium organophilum]
MLGHSVDKYVTGRLLDTSNGLGWTQLHAERWSHMPGELPALTPKDTEIAILLQGRSFVDRIGSGQRQQTHGHRGTVWVCPAGIEEEYINISDPMLDCLHIFLPAHPFEETMLRDLNVDPSKVELRYDVIPQDPFIDYVASRILQEMECESAAGRLLIESLGIALSAHLVHRYSTAKVRQRETADKPLDRRRLERVEAFIANHLFDDLTVAELAAVACMSVAHFTRSFRAATGRTPYDYVSGCRLDLAKRRLLNEDTQIAEIAAATGFSSQANFTRAFRKALGVTPAQLRASAQN